MHHRTGFMDCQMGASALMLFMTLIYCMPISADPATIVGRWQLDVMLSDNAVDKLKGIRASKHKYIPSMVRESDRPSTQSTEQRYWQELNEGREWKRSKELAHAGPVQRLLESENLEIVTANGGFLFIYADGYERKVIPNPGGRIFTASGNELVSTEIGHTLAYWKDASLMLETRTAHGGKLTEYIETSADGTRLTMKIEIDRRDWKQIVYLDRVFNRVGDNNLKTTSH